MRRRLVVLALVLASACSGGDADRDEAASTTTSTTERPSTTTSTVLNPIVEVSTSAECPGIGAAPADAAITWIADGHLWQASPDGENRTCLLEAGYPSLEWGGGADRVRIDDTVVVGDDVSVLGSTDRHLDSFSRPSGRAVLAQASSGEAFKLSLDGTPPLPLPTFDGSSDLLYHPAGLAIVAVRTGGPFPEILMASNEGADPQWLVEGESAEEIRDLGFTATGQLVFIATHDDGDHVHWYDIETSELLTLVHVTGDERATDVVASPFRPWDIAVARRVEHTQTAPWVSVDNRVVDLAGTAVEHGRPIGWLPDGGLLMGVYEDDVACCDVPPFDLYVLRDGVTELVERQVMAAAVRAELPPPPPHPERIPSEAMY